MKNTVTFKQAIEDIEENEGWLYCNTTEKPDENSAAFFYKADLELSPAEEKETRDEFKKSGFQPYLTKEDIEDVIFNLEEQVENPTFNEKLKAIRYFHENDAFIEMDK
ncbi:hypothetical protein M4R22_03410 [Acidovorax sp. GBBC 3334]|uniref:DUF7716 domain-containing protein n=1 Tax=Acidovorax sp. GBBC 3334 TaxID=2940496 RepID=UPI002303E254|nr:hypothetical protein [Acidovorax sp. GBBC 3334]MDA8453805.1 hypothetical protein [Acidovorax sp. GBBC 3334]